MAAPWPRRGLVNAAIHILWQQPGRVRVLEHDKHPGVALCKLGTPLPQRVRHLQQAADVDKGDLECPRSGVNLQEQHRIVSTLRLVLHCEVELAEGAPSKFCC